MAWDDLGNIADITESAFTLCCKSFVVFVLAPGPRG